MSFTCLDDPILCPQSDRCPACTVKYLHAAEKMLRKQLTIERRERTTFKWALKHLQQSTLLDLNNLGPARFVACVLDKPNTDPEYLKHLEVKS